MLILLLLFIWSYGCFREIKTISIAGASSCFNHWNFTATVGDPTGRSSTRPPLTREEVLANAETYTDQAQILDREQTEVVYNGEWFENDLKKSSNLMQE